MTSAYTINLNPNITTPVKTGYTFKSGDKGITFNLVVQEMDPTGTSAKIAFHRANGTSVEAALSGQGPTYSYMILGNEFAVPGVVVADVKFYQSTTQRVSTASFVFNVINDTLDGLGGGTAGYSDELETLSAAMEGYIEAFGNLGPINPRGAYNASTAYEPADCVSYNGNSWLCIQPCTGVTPSEGAYWQQVADMATGKADKVAGATNGNLAALNSAGNLTDSGIKASTVPEKYDNFGYHNSIYRGKNLGTISTAAQLETFLSDHEVASGKFTDLYVGDYLNLNDGTYNKTWVIAGFDTEYNKGGANPLTTHHITLIPTSKLFDAQMNDSNTTSGGYIATKMHTSVLPGLVTSLQNLLGNHLLPREIEVSNAISGGQSSNWEWVTAYASLMTEVQVYGSMVWGSKFDVGEGLSKLPLFNYVNPVQYSRVTFWLRAVATANNFAVVYERGGADRAGAGTQLGVRPLICIG